MAKNNRKISWIWMSALILFVSVAATTTAVLSKLDSYLLSDEGAIPLIPEITAEAPAEPPKDTAKEEAPEVSPEAPANVAESTVEIDGANTANPAPATTQSTKTPQKAGFEVSDGKTVWSTNTQVDIFRISYENDRERVTVESDNGDKVIAPGTDNSYTFKLKNTGDVPLDYTLEIDAYFTPGDIAIPITGRLNRYDGEWIVGSQDEYVEVSVLDTAEDSATLGAGKYTYYTLDWSWPFKSGDSFSERLRGDRVDTRLGDRADREDLAFTIVIKTTAEGSLDTDNDSGIKPPQTGDNANIVLWIALMAGSLVMMIILLLLKSREKRSNAEAEEH